jgi:hypothetical protein
MERIRIVPHVLQVGDRYVTLPADDDERHGIAVVADRQLANEVAGDIGSECVPIAVSADEVVRVCEELRIPLVVLIRRDVFRKGEVEGSVFTLESFLSIFEETK